MMGFIVHGLTYLRRVCIRKLTVLVRTPMEFTSDPCSRLHIPVFVRTTSKLLLMPDECWSEEVDKGFITGCL